MSTKLELESPYREIYKSGYLVLNPEGRRTLILYNSHQDRTSTQYARYLVSVRLGRFLNQGEQVDHIDGDKTNDSLDNLQVLSLVDNVRKSNKLPDVMLVCPVCGVGFSRTRSQLHGKLEKALSGNLCCSRVCGGKKSHLSLGRVA